MDAGIASLAATRAGGWGYWVGLLGESDPPERLRRRLTADVDKKKNKNKQTPQPKARKKDKEHMMEIK